MIFSPILSLDDGLRQKTIGEGPPDFAAASVDQPAPGPALRVADSFFATAVPG
jgi:hypothetical protein